MIRSVERCRSLGRETFYGMSLQVAVTSSDSRTHLFEVSTDCPDGHLGLSQLHIILNRKQVDRPMESRGQNR